MFSGTTLKRGVISKMATGLLMDHIVLREIVIKINHVVCGLRLRYDVLR